MNPEKFVKEVMRQLDGLIEEGSPVNFDLSVGLAYSRETNELSPTVGAGDTKISFTVVAGSKRGKL